MIDIKIMASPQRKENVDALLRQLNMDESIVIYDDRENGGDAMYVAKKVWTAPIPNGCTHRLVLQDDIELCDDFINIVNRIILAQPDKVITLFSSIMQLSKDMTNTPYLKCPVIWGCGLIMPTQYIQPCFQWIQEHVDNVNATIDTYMINEWCNASRTTRLATVPSIVQHIGDASLLGHSPIRSLCYARNPVANWDSEVFIC